MQTKKEKRHFVACENGFHKIVKRILQRPEADLNTIAKSGSAFGLAVENWHYKVVQILIESEKIIYQHEGEESPLHRACLRGSLKMVKLLFSIDPNKINKNEVDDVFIYNFTERNSYKYFLIRLFYILLILMVKKILSIFF